MRNAIGAPLGLPAAKHNRYSGELAEFRRTLGSSATAAKIDLSLLLKYLPIVSVEAFTTRSAAPPNSVGVLSDR